jgi:AcrR family transcriptional regulator
MMTGTGRLGRPREERVDESLAAAVRELLTRMEYPKVTVDAIAARAGVGKPAIYRRYRSKADLVLSVMLRRPESASPDTGTLRTDLAVLMERMYRDLSSPLAVSALPGLLADVAADSELSQRFDDLVTCERDTVVRLCGSAVARGELPQMPDTDLVHALMVGPVLLRSLTTRPPVSPRQLRGHVEGLVRALGLVDRNAM